jgi:hypothetical protein
MENNDIDASIKELSQITRDDGNEKYADAQFGLGFIYIKDWNGNTYSNNKIMGYHHLSNSTGGKLNK